MNQAISLEALALYLRDLASGERRQLVALAGSPGAGKSHIADALHQKLSTERPGKVAVLPMDGFHYDDIVLSERGDLPRKGAPHTFDTGGLLSTLKRLSADDGAEIAVPIFDRTIEIARAGARIITPEARLIIVEGNYLLLDDKRWQPLTALFDKTVFIDVPEPVLRQRLEQRWAHFSPQSRADKLEGNDLPNMRLVLSQSVAADFRLTNG